MMSTVFSASGSAMAASGDAEAARGTTSSDAAAEAADDLHPTTVTTEATNSMTATSNEAAPMAVLVDQAEEEGDEARHLTSGKETAIYTEGGGATVCPLGKERFPLITYVVINLNSGPYTSASAPWAVIERVSIFVICNHKPYFQNNKHMHLGHFGCLVRVGPVRLFTNTNMFLQLRFQCRCKHQC